MRRPALAIFILMVILIVFSDYFCVPLKPNMVEKAGLEGEYLTYAAKVERVELKDDKTRLEVSLITAEGREIKTGNHVLLTRYDTVENYEDLLCRIIEFKTELKPAAERRNPNTFDYRRYLKSKNIGLVGTIEFFTVSDTGFGMIESYKRFLFRKRVEFRNSLPDNSRGIIMGLIFGDTSELDDETYDSFRMNGTAHVLAVSGLHVGLLYKLFLSIFGQLNRRWKYILLVFVMLTYGTLAMWSASVLRAEMMITLKIIAERADLRYDMLNSACFVGIIIILRNPYAIFGASFQMSFLAVMSISFIYPMLKDKVPDVISLSLSVNLGLLCYQIYNFNYISFTAVFANVFIIMIVSVLVPLAVISFSLFLLTGSVDIVERVTDILAQILVKVNDFSTLNGHGAIEVPSPGLVFAILGTSLVFFLCSEWLYVLINRKNAELIRKSVALITTAAILAQLMFGSLVSYDDLIFVDVGQGDCIHINDGRTDILIDGGGNFNYNIGENTLKPYLLKNGNADVDLAVLTHEHMDHMKGIEELKEVYKVKDVKLRLTAGSTINVSDELYIETLWPTEINDSQGQDDNEDCSVFMVHYKGYRILITGDLDSEGEKKLLSLCPKEKLRADILKVGHHGSKTSSSPEFVSAVSPTYAVIQVGKNNYGHPSPEAISVLEYSGAIVYTNLDSGAIGFNLKKRTIKCHTVLPKKNMLLKFLTEI